MPRHPRLGHAENARQLGDVQPLGRKQPQDPQPDLVAQEPEQADRVFIYMNIHACMAYCQRRGSVGLGSGWAWLRSVDPAARAVTLANQRQPDPT